MKQFKTYVVVYVDFDGHKVTDYYTARNADEAYSYFMALDEVLEVDSVEVAQ